MNNTSKQTVHYFPIITKHSVQEYIKAVECQQLSHPGISCTGFPTATQEHPRLLCAVYHCNAKLKQIPRQTVDPDHEQNLINSFSFQRTPFPTKTKKIIHIFCTIPWMNK